MMSYNKKFAYSRFVPSACDGLDKAGTYFRSAGVLLSLRRRKPDDFAQDSQLGVLIFHAYSMQADTTLRRVILVEEFAPTKNKKDKKS
jgi:hypothetical protein